jgi:hypothetical protein
MNKLPSLGEVSLFIGMTAMALNGSQAREGTREHGRKRRVLESLKSKDCRAESQGQECTWQRGTTL